MWGVNNMKFSTKQLLVIKWRDAFHPERCNWWDFEEVKDFVEDTEFIVWNAGWIIHEDKNFYTLSSMIAGHGKAVSHIQRIPKGCVIEIKKFSYKLTCI